MQTPGPLTPRKLLIGALMVAWLVAMLTLLQDRYDDSDRRKAGELLALKQAGGWSVQDELAARAAPALPSCESIITSSFAGTLEIQCIAVDGPPYRFGADLVRRQLRAMDPHTQTLLDAVAAKNQQTVGHPKDAGQGV